MRPCGATRRGEVDIFRHWPKILYSLWATEEDFIVNGKATKMTIYKHIMLMRAIEPLTIFMAYKKIKKR